MLYDDDNNDQQHLFAEESGMATQHRLTKAEMIQGMANRVMYSKYYIGLYLTLGLLSLISIILSIQETCPSLTFIIFEAIINFAMIIEVSIRFLALRRKYWRSLWNVVDVILVGLCAITLIVLATGCSAGERREAIVDTILLVIRNCLQFFRLFTMARSKKNSMTTRPVDFNDIPADRPHSVEFSLLDPEQDIYDSDSEPDAR